MKLEKTSVKKPITIDIEVKEGLLYILCTAEVENLWLHGHKIIPLKNLEGFK